MPDPDIPEHLVVSTSDTGFDRGFAHLPPISGKHSGEILVYESSSASSPCIWLNVGEESRHLTAESAWKLADQLRHLVLHHYQGDARPEWAREDVAGG